MIKQRCNVLLLSMLLLSMVACKEEVKKSRVIRPVKTIQLSTSETSMQTLQLPASLNEVRGSKLSFRVGGPLVMLNDVVGSKVSKGDVIAKIDSRDFDIAVEATETAFHLAKTEYERYKRLAELGSVSKSMHDQMETNYKTAKTAYESAQNALKDTKLLAPFTGHISGVFTNNFETVAPGQAITALHDMSSLEVNAWIPVEDANSINDSTQFTCVVKHNNKEQRIVGRLKELGKKTGVLKQSLPITIVVDNNQNLSLKAGMSVYLEIDDKTSTVSKGIQIPNASVFTKNNQTMVWVFNVSNHLVNSKQVKLGNIQDDGNIDVIEGLRGDECVVIAGVHSLFEGQKVKKMNDVSKSNVGNKL